MAADGTLDTVGTAFCISSDGKQSYFLTNNHVVTDDNGQPETNLVAILARDMGDAQAPRYHATIVRRSGDPDLAVVSVQVPNITPVHISATLPHVGDDIAIAGFPYNESVLWGRLFGGKAFRMDRPFPPDLTPSEHKGAVSALHGGDYYIQYDALTDNGNSGGPLFDPQTGEVYGIVQASVDGAPEDRDLPSSIHNNLAISIREGWQFIAQSPVTLSPTDVATATSEHFAPRSKACMRYGRIAARQAHARSAIEAIRAHLNDPHYAAKRARMQRAIASYQKVLRNKAKAPPGCAA